MNYEVVTALGFKGIDLIDARLHLKTPSNITAEDDLISSYIAAANKYIEEATGLVVSLSTLAGWLDCWPADSLITINKGPIVSVDAVKYYNAANILTTMTPDVDYFVDTVSQPARIQIVNEPDLYERVNAIKVEFTAGYSGIVNVDDRIKQALRLMITQCEQDRASYVKGNIVIALPFGFRNFVNQMTIYEL